MQFEIKESRLVSRTRLIRREFEEFAEIEEKRGRIHLDNDQLQVGILIGR